MDLSGQKKEIWVYLSHEKGRIGQSSFDLLAKARQITGGLGYTVAAVLLTDDAQDMTQQLAKKGIGKIYSGQVGAEKAKDHMFLARSLKAQIELFGPEIFLFPCAQTPALVASTLAAKLRTGLMAHCVDVFLNEKEILTGLIPAYGGKYLGEIFCPLHKPQMATVYAAKADDNCTASDNNIEIVSLAVADNGKTGPAELVGEYPQPQKGLPLEQAEIIVCGGRGVGSSANWRLLEEFAAQLDAAVGCTRPPIDQGWVEDEKTMIGTSGKSVRPKIYIGFGVSGTSHHICGMQDSQIIININQDENAPSFAISDYAFVADAAAVLPALLEKLKA